MKKVTLEISEMLFSIAERVANECPHSTPEELLSGALGTGLMRLINLDPVDHQAERFYETVAHLQAENDMLKRLLREAIKESIGIEESYAALSSRFNDEQIPF